LRKIKEIQKS